MGFVRKFPDQTKHKNSIFKIDHKNKLDLSYIPQRLPNREKHIKEIINQFSSEEVIILFSDSTAPTIVKDNSKSESLYVLMPMRV